MGFYQTCLFCYTIKQLLLIPLLLLLILHSSLPQQAYMVEGSRPLSPNAVKTLKVKEKQAKMMMMMGRALIGSRPPRCERKCSNCGHCEAIQVPVVPQHENSKVVAAVHEGSNKRRKGGHHRFENSVPRIQYSRGDGLSNYKPMSWKCKCGNLIFNP